MANIGIEDRIKQYVSNSQIRKSKVMAFRNWISLKNKDFSLMDGLKCIFMAAKDSFNKVDELLDRITEKHKLQGRTQVYNVTPRSEIDIIKDKNGFLKITGLDAYKEEMPKGQHREDTGGFKKSGEKGELRKKLERSMKDLETEVLALYPNQHSQYIYMAMRTIRNYAIQKKKSPEYVVNMLKKGRLTLDDEVWRIKPNITNENVYKKRTIIITESMAQSLKESITEHKFNSNVKSFISQLLQDPVNTDVPKMFKDMGIKRSRLLNLLTNNNLIVRSEKISDKDENGNPKTATMLVKFKCPKKNFDRNLRKLFIRLFEKNLPKFEMNEEDGGNGATSANSSGSFETALDSPIIRRPMPHTGLEETTSTSSVSDGNPENMEYAVPFPVNKKDKSMKRPRGKIIGGFEK